MKNNYEEIKKIQSVANTCPSALHKIQQQSLSPKLKVALYKTILRSLPCMP